MDEQAFFYVDLKMKTLADELLNEINILQV